MKSQMLSRDEFTVVLENIFPYFILLMYVMPLYRTIFAMVHEKVLKFKLFIFVGKLNKGEYEDDGFV